MNSWRIGLAIAGMALTAWTQTAVVGYQDLVATVTATAVAAAPDTTRTVVVSHFSGWVTQVLVDAPFAEVKAGEPLCVIDSPDLQADEDDYVAAAAYAAALPSGPAATGAARVLAAARERLGQEQVPPEEQARLERTGQATSTLTLSAPTAGVAMTRTAVPQLRVTPATELYTLSVLDPIWVYADVPEDQLEAVRAGGAAQIRFDAFPGRSYSGRVAAIEPQVAAGTRTVPVRIVVANPDHSILPGLSGTALLRRAAGRRLVLPAAAVLHAGTQDVVFVAQTEGQYARRQVRLGTRIGDDYVVLGGVRAGERVSTAANFLLDADAQLTGAAGGFVPPPPGVGANAAPSPQAVTLALTTDPAPARAGVNQLRVRLMPALTGAAVTVTFFMPAMPAMGMAEMKYVVPLHAQGGGLYEGEVTLGSAGAWQVTVTASQGGKPVTALHTTVRASGGGQ